MLTPGTPFGPYDVKAMIGQGGMGDVYRAHDPRLKRDVALKVLSAPFARDTDRLARFQREAELLASLHHPNIAGLYGIEEADGERALVMELVDGSTLADRMAGGPISLEEVLAIARQIASALMAAHDAGIIHRDLKPANIKVRTDGAVKVLDFGLAREVSSLTAISGSPTVTTPALTEAGMILGTAAYMSPEQAKGRAVDRRADIWAFGCVVFEMLTGRAVFRGNSTAEVLAAVLERQPDWSALPPRTPVALARLLRRCLDKDPQRRLRDIGDALLDLEDAGGHDPPADRGSRRTPRLAGAALLLVLGMLFGGLMMWRLAPQSTPPRVGRFSIALPADLSLGDLDSPAFALSPDGRRIVLVSGDTTPRLFVRELDDPRPRPLAGTEGASSPFFSPDGRMVGFFTGGRVKKVSIDGGDPVTICGAVGNARGGAWNVDGTIAFTPAPGAAIFRVSADGGTPEPFTRLDVDRGEGAHHWPEFLPNGKAILYTVGLGTTASWDERDIVAESLVTHERHVVAHGTAARYVEPGQLIVARGGALTVMPFDASRLQTTGAPVRIVDGVMQSAVGAAQFSVSRNGTYAYLAGGLIERELVSVSRTGAVTSMPTPGGTYWSVRVSPDGQRLALGVEAANYGVWTYDINRGTMTRVTFKGTSAFPIWTPDGNRLTFNSTKTGGVLNLFWRAADGSGEEEQLTRSDAIEVPNSWSPDGKVLAYQHSDLQTGRDIWLLSLEERSTPTTLLQTPFEEGGAAFSPDGRWLAYVSTEGGAANVYVRSFPGPGQKVQISTSGGGGPVWSRDGRELFYRTSDRMMAVEVTSHGVFQASKATVLFDTPVGRRPIFQADYDVTADGQRFIMIRQRGEPRLQTQIEIGINAVTPTERLRPAQ